MIAGNDLFVALHRMVKINVTTHQALTLFIVREHPGASYTDIALLLDGKGDGYRRYGNFVRLLVQRGLLEDRRTITHERTPGRIFISEKGEAVLKEISEGL